VLKEFVTAELKKVEHFPPETAALSGAPSGMDRLERDVRRRAVLRDSCVIRKTSVSLIAGFAQKGRSAQKLLNLHKKGSYRSGRSAPICVVGSKAIL
jgi:hypothetical protein